MSDLLTAARQALPGLEWEEDVDGAVHTVAYDSTVCMHRSTPDKVHAWIGIHETRMATPDEAAQWLRAQVESRRNALDAALGESDRGTNAEKLAAIQARIPATYNGNLDAIFAHAAAYHGLGVTMVCAQTWEDGDDLSYEEQLALLIRQRDEVGEKLRALTGLVAEWKVIYHAEGCVGKYVPACSCGFGVKEAIARAEARRLLLEVKPTVAAPAIKTGRECPNCDSDEVFSDGDTQFEGTLHQCEQCGKWAAISVTAGRYVLVDAPEPQAVPSQGGEVENG